MAKDAGRADSPPVQRLEQALTSQLNNAQVVMNQTASRSNKVFRGDTMTSKQSKSHISRMNSKASLISSKKKGPGVGLKLKIDELQKQVQEMKLNVDKNLEDVRVLRNTEIDRKKRFDTMEETVKYLQQTHDRWNEDHDELMLRQTEISDQHKSDMDKVEDIYERMLKIFKDTQRIISLFRKEYKIGFERIVRCEVQLGEVSISYLCYVIVTLYLAQ